MFVGSGCIVDSSFALESKRPSIADAVRAIDVSVLIQVGWVARTDAGAVGDRGPGGIGRRRSIEPAPLSVAVASPVLERVLTVGTEEFQVTEAVKLAVLPSLFFK